jgi:hypothetical protein
MLDCTFKKLREAEFFLGHLLALTLPVMNRESEVPDFYLSAFFTAARSVTFILQIEYPYEFKLRYRDWSARLSAEDRDLVDFFANQQNRITKEGAAGGIFVTVSLIEFMQDFHQQGESSISDGFQSYLGLLKQLVAEFGRENPST